MIDFREEEVVSLAKAAKQLPGRVEGKSLHVGSIHRWANRGRRGVVLETIMVGGRRCTSMEALDRFFRRLTAGDERRSEAAPRARTAGPTREELVAAGIAAVDEAERGP